MRDQIDLMKKAGFEEARWVANTITKTAEHTVGALFLARRPGPEIA